MYSRERRYGVYTDITRDPLNVAAWLVWDSTFWIFVFLNGVQGDPSVSEGNSGLWYYNFWMANSSH